MLYFKRCCLTAICQFVDVFVQHQIVECLMWYD